MCKRMLSLALVLALLLSLVAVPRARAGGTPAEKTVYFTLSNDGAIVIGNDADSTRLNRVEVTVPYFDLGLYGMDEFYRYEADTFENGGGYISSVVVESPTVLHLYIYMLERYYYGLKEEDCGKGLTHLESLGITFGQPCAAPPLDELGNATGSGNGLSYSGSPTSFYMTNFWGHDENLMYYVNHAYPLMTTNWGATADYILLEDGDTVDVAMFTNWNFYLDGFFCYLDPEMVECTAGDSRTFQAYGVPTSAGLDGATKPQEAVDLNWAVLNEKGEQVAESTDASASFTYTFGQAGQFTVLGYDPNRGTADACMAPAVAVVTVAAGNTAPVLAGAASGTVMAQVLEPCAIDLNGVFLDAEGDSLTYSVSADGQNYDEMATSRYVFTPAAEGQQVLYFKASDGVLESPVYTVTVMVEAAAGLLSALRFANASSATAEPLAMTPDFTADQFAYTMTVPDSKSSTYAWATFAGENTGTIQVTYTDYSGTEQAISLTSGKSGGQYLRNAFQAGGGGNTLQVQATSGEVSQIYTVQVNRSRTLSGLTVTDGQGAELILDQPFQPDVLSYTANTTDAQIILAPVLRNENYAVTYNGSEDNVVQLQDGANVIELLVSYPADGTSTTYTLTVNKVEPVLVSFALTPEDAVVNFTDSAGTRLWPDEAGQYSLIPGNDYGYTVTKNGYIGQKNNFTAESAGVVEIELSRAAENDAIDKTIYAQWANFRNGDNHLGITAAKTPYAPEDAELLWAAKYGAGWSAAPGSPIIVDGDLVTYVGATIKRLDRNTGEVVANGEMVGSSSFSIVPPTYADGIIFVGLSGGRIQAFNAETLESLWVYTDPLGGQPNCPITYKDGYLYAGFWNSETRNANFVCLSATDEDVTRTTEEKLSTWTYTSRGGFYWAGAYASDRFVVVGTDDGESGYAAQSARLLVFDRITGRLMDEETGFRGDIRSNVSYDPETDRVFFTTKGGQLCNARVDWQTGEISQVNKTEISDAKGNTGVMSTCTPSVYNDRIYIGVSGQSQFGANSGHAISVYDLAEDGAMTLAYAYAIVGYPQTSAMVSTGYVEESGYVYIYLPYNMTPGGVSVLKDKKGQTEPLTTTDSGYSEVFTPVSPLAQYCICSTIADEYGTIYYKNDSGYMMALTSKIASIQVTKRPDKLRYSGETFDPTGMTVVANLENGGQRDITQYVTWPEEAISAGQQSVTLSYTYGFDHENYGQQTKTVELPLNQPAAQVEVELQAQAENGFLLAPQMVTVTGDLAESYGYTDQVTYCDGVSALDVLVRAHELIFGGDFTLETAQALLMVGDSGTITKLFGVETGNCGFTINELIPTGDEASPWGGYTAYTLNEAVVTGGDQVSFFLYQDDWVSDLYTWYVQDGTVTRELQAEAKLPMDITVNGYLIGWTGYMYKTFDEIVADVNNTMAVSDAQIALVDLDSGAITDIAGAVTDEDGQVALTFPEAGVYAITAYVPAQAQAERYATPAIMTLATVTVSEHTHRWSDWQVETQPSCTQDGVQTRHCPCGETEQAAISATGHRFADTVVAPSCTEKGYTLHTCALCGYHYTSNEVEAQGHSWGQWVLTQPGSCFHPGVETRTCSACQATEIREAGLNPDNCPSKAFADLNTNAWYHEGVDFALNQGLMNGVGNRRFAPNHRMTRAMVVMVLYRLAGAPEVTGTVEFTDVPEDQYYYEALVWATKAGLAKGVTETTFAPGNAITREQLATFLYRYAQYAGMDVGGQADMDAFADKDKVSGYAAEAVAWAVAGGIINGMENNTLAPRANATRGQVATMLMRLTQL